MSSAGNGGQQTAAYLATLSREELIARVHELETQVTAMRHLIGPSGQSIAGSADGGGGKAGKRRRCREGRVDFAQYRQRRIALKIAYLGWAFDGSAQQDNTDNTVLGRLCEGLRRVQLIESADACSLVTCARTDKGVSALANVVSLNVRSLLADCQGCLPDSGPEIGKRRSAPSCEDTEAAELDYVGPLNRVLPRELRVLAWAPVATDFSARFACTSRQYLYHFPRGALRVDLMRQACASFLGQRDFRSFTKFSPDQRGNYHRTVLECDIVPADDSNCGGGGSAPTDADSGQRIYVFRVRATAFLYHQIRNMFSVLALVGAGLEDPGIVARLLDVGDVPRKPEYVLADGLPLVLSDTSFPPDILAWRTSAEARSHLSVTLQRLWTELAVRDRLSGLLLDRLGLSDYDQTCSGLVAELRCRQHRLLLTRQTQASFEELARRSDAKRQELEELRQSDSAVVVDEVDCQLGDVSTEDGQTSPKRTRSAADCYE